MKKGVPFRQAHHIIGRVVSEAEKRGVDITDLPLGDLQKFSPLFGSDIVAVADYSNNVQQYNAIGGTASSSIVEQLRLLKKCARDLAKQS